MESTDTTTSLDDDRIAAKAAEIDQKMARLGKTASYESPIEARIIGRIDEALDELQQKAGYEAVERALTWAADKYLPSRTVVRLTEMAEKYLDQVKDAE